MNPGTLPRAGVPRRRADKGGRRGAPSAPAANPHDLTIILPLAGKTIRVPYRPVSWDGIFIRKYAAKVSG